MTRKIGLALGGGAALGWAHIGVLQVLEENDIRPDVVAGTSIGSLIGACYVADQFEALETIARGLTRLGMMRFADVQVGKNGFFRGDPVVKELRKYLGKLKIEDMGVPFGAVATDLVTGQQVTFTTGDVVKAVRASLSIPGVFTPVRFGNQLLVDGGLTNNVPTSVCRELGADIVIAINITGDFEGQAAAAGILQADSEEADVEAPDNDAADNEVEDSEVRVDIGSKTKAAFASLGNSVGRYFRKSEKEPSFLGVSLTSAALIMRELGRGQERACPPDICIEPKVGHITLIEFDRADELIAIGREAVEARLDEIRALLN